MGTLLTVACPVWGGVWEVGHTGWDAELDVLRAVRLN